MTIVCCTNAIGSYIQSYFLKKKHEKSVTDRQTETRDLFLRTLRVMKGRENVQVESRATNSITILPLLTLKWTCGWCTYWHTRTSITIKMDEYQNFCKTVKTFPSTQNLVKTIQIILFICDSHGSHKCIYALTYDQQNGFYMLCRVDMGYKCAVCAHMECILFPAIDWNILNSQSPTGESKIY